MPHLVLLGDSIFDNSKYVPDGPAVTDHVRKALPAGWQVTLLAVDKTVCDGVAAQVEKIPADATHIVLSIGGNNAIAKLSVLFSGKTASFYEVSMVFAETHNEFRDSYQKMLDNILQRGLPTAICTIYDGLPILNATAKAALSLFNDTIVREAVRRRLTLIDLRYVCPEGSDYSALSPMEPSATGGAKVATAIKQAVLPAENYREGRIVW